MSKRISLFFSGLLVAILALTTLMIGGSAGAFSPQRPQALKREVATSAARNAAIVATTSAVLKETSEIRDLPILRPVKSGAESRADIERMLIRNLDKQRTPAEMHAAELALKKFGLVPGNFEYRPFIIKLLTEQVAGYYDTKDQRFRIADWLDLEGQKPVMAHELTHALQDQHFNLRRFEKWPRGDSDAQLAAHALIEGDATLAMTMYMLRYPLVALAFTRSLGAGGMVTEQYDQAPRAIRESLIFPYMNGSEWATQVYKRGGWPAISKAYTNLPLSSEQIIHPEKYFSYERPVKIALPDVSSLLNRAISNQQPAISSQPAIGTAGVSPAPRSQRSTSGAVPNRRPQPARKLPTAPRSLPAVSWRRLDSDVNGEWSYYLLLDQFLKAPSESRRAAAGWGGDRYDLYEGPAGGVFLAQLTSWDTENDAREFFDAYVKRTALRYALANPVEVASARKDVQREWRTAEGGVLVELRGSRVLILEGIPSGVGVDAMLKAVWQ